MEQQVERLDPVSKALIACQAITQMLVTLNVVMNNQIWIDHLRSKDDDYPDFAKKIMTDGIAEKENFMNETVGKLSTIMEEVADFMNGGDMVSSIDFRMYKVPFEILLEGKDEVENLYDDEEEFRDAPPFA